MLPTLAPLLVAGVLSLLPGDNSPRLVTRGSDGLPAAGESGRAGLGLAGGGRFVVFASSADGLVPGDADGQQDVFLLDVSLERLERVSVTSDGAPADGPSSHPTVSDDGRYVVFASTAGNLGAGGSPHGAVYLRDRRAGTTTCLSVTPEGRAAGGTSHPVVSSDGRFVAFQSSAADLVDGDTNDAPDVFLHDRATGLTRCLSRAPSGRTAAGASTAPALSGDGSWIAFVSDAPDLLPHPTHPGPGLYLLERDTFALQRIDGPGQAPADPLSRPALSRDGRVLAWCARDGTPLLAEGGPFDAAGPGSRFGRAPWSERPVQVLLHDRERGLTSLASCDAAGGPADADCARPSLSGDGQLVAFESLAGNLAPDLPPGLFPRLFVRDRLLGTTRRLLQRGSGTGERPLLSRDGSALAVVSSDPHLTGREDGLPQVFLLDA